MTFLSLLLQNLPQFPLPTHDVVVRYWPPPEFEVLVISFARKFVTSRLYFPSVVNFVTPFSAQYRCF